MHTHIRCGLFCFIYIYIYRRCVDSVAIFMCTFYDVINYINISPYVSLQNRLLRLLCARKRTILPGQFCEGFARDQVNVTKSLFLVLLVGTAEMGR
jgi:hypothetical protein